MTDSGTDERRFQVVVNEEGQYSVWEQGWSIPPGWSADGFVGARDACLEHVDRVWTDMRPRSLRG